MVQKWANLPFDKSSFLIHISGTMEPEKLAQQTQFIHLYDLK